MVRSIVALTEHDSLMVAVRLTACLYDMLPILSLTMFERMPISQVLARLAIPDAGPTLDNPLNVFD